MQLEWTEHIQIYLLAGAVSTYFCLVRAPEPFLAKSFVQFTTRINISHMKLPEQTGVPATRPEMDAREAYKAHCAQYPGVAPQAPCERAKSAKFLDDVTP